MLKTENSGDPKSELGIVSEKGSRMQETLEDCILSLHGLSEGSKVNYKSQVKTFGHFLMNQGLRNLKM